MSINKKRDLIGLILGLVILVAVNYLSTLAFQRFDLTTENRYSLSESTKKLLQSLDNKVYVRVYLEGDFPAEYKRLRNETREMLNEFKAYSNGHLDFLFINPSESSKLKVRDEVYKKIYDKGLRPTDLEVKEEDGISQKIIWPGALISFKDIEYPVQILSSSVTTNPERMINQSIESLEYVLANGIKNATNTEVKAVGITEGHGEYDKYELADLMGSLRERYNVERVNFNENISAFSERFFKDSSNALVRNKYAAIIIAGPTARFSEKDKYILDQYVMKGGKILWALDMVDITMDSLKTANTTLATPRDLNLADLLFKYGIRINKDLVMDLRAAPIPVVQGTVGNQPKTTLFPWYYFPLMVPEGEHPISKNLGAIRGEFMNSIDFVGGNESMKKSVLLTTSEYTKLVKAPTRVSLNVLRFDPPREQYNIKNVPVAALVEGKFESVFKNRLTSEFTESGILEFQEQTEKDNKMIFISDGNVLKNERKKNTNEYYPMGYDEYARNVFANRDFILNSMDYLLDDSKLILSNNKTLKIRLLNREVVDDNRLFWKTLNVALPVFFIILLGAVIHYIRKKIYISKS